MIRALFRAILFGLSAAVVSVASYFIASIIGGFVQAPIADLADSPDQPRDQKILLIPGPIHVDLALPLDATLRQRFAFLSESGLAIEDPAAAYLIIGWGSKAFYTSTGGYTDIQFGAVFKAITGDRSVMHVSLSGPLDQVSGLVQVSMSKAGYERLQSYVREGFAQGIEEPAHLPGISLGYGDVFYVGNGWFSAFRPCNIWVAEGLRQAGVGVGIWTPTRQSLMISISRFAKLPE